MSLYRRTDSENWWSRIMVNGVLHQFTTGTANKNLARAVEASKRTELLKADVGLDAPTLDAFARRFISSLPGRVSAETATFYLGHSKPLIAFKPLADCKLDRIDSPLIELFISHRQKTVTKTTVNHSLRTLRRMLHKAAEWNLLAKVPKVRLLPNEHSREYVLSAAPVERFEQLPGLIAQLVPFLVDTGLRRREAVELTWDQVNFEERYIHIRKSKSKAGRRKIPMTKRVERILRELPRCDDRVFTRNGKRIKRDWIDHVFLDTRRELGLPDEACLHSCRHTFCTNLGERGASAFQIQQLAGHASISISQRYVHPDKSNLDAAIALLD